jgi:hypothetical protein
MDGRGGNPRSTPIEPGSVLPETLIDSCIIDPTAQ